MYICEICHTQTAAGVPCNITVTEVRARTYTPRPKANDPGGAGFEIVKEILACPFCSRGD